MLVAFIAVSSHSAFALGIGAAETDSYIGEKLSVRIPLFNVASPNSLQLAIETQQFGGNQQSTVQIALDRSNSQLAIRLSSQQVINEPYLNFKLRINDNNTEFEKEFAILLNLSGQGQISNLNDRSRSVTSNRYPSSEPINSGAVNTSVNSHSADSLMGPYETAVAGQIPKRFGAVLDGQSIWRVARRINGAMGVSQSQMIWALYQANPDAFFSDSIESLKAGAFLNIPSEEQVKRVSHLQAKENLQALRLNQNVPEAINDSSSTQLSESENTPNNELIDEVKTDEKLAEQKIETPFQVTSIDESGNGVSAQSQSDSIIASLTETVGNMSQQLERKDKKIEFLEGQVEELKNFISSEDLTTLKSNNDIAQATSSIEPLPVSDVDNVALPVDEPLNSSEQASNQSSVFSWLNNFWLWGLLSFLTLAALAFFTRNRILSLMQNLNIFDKRADVEFSVAEVEHESIIRIPSKVSRDSKRVERAINAEAAIENPTPEEDVTTDVEPSKSIYTSGVDIDQHNSFDEGSISVNTHMVEEEEFIEMASISFDNEYEKEDSELNLESDEFEKPLAINIEAPSEEKVRFVKNDLPEGVLDNAQDDDGDVEKTIHIIGSEVSERINDEEQNFDLRLEGLFMSKDYESARELLDFSRNSEIDDQRYHLERLRLLQKLDNEQDFYEYYYSIEDYISDYRLDIQTKISQLVVRLAGNA